MKKGNTTFNISENPFNSSKNSPKSKELDLKKSISASPFQNEYQKQELEKLKLHRILSKSMVKQ